MAAWRRALDAASSRARLEPADRRLVREAGEHDRAQPQRCADPELGPLEADVEHVQDPAQESQRGGVVARYEGGDLGHPGGAGIRDQLRGESGSDAAVLQLVGDLECDLRARAVADEARDRGRPRVTLHVGDEHVVVRVGRRPAARGRCC